MARIQPDAFSLNLECRHSSEDPARISSALEIEPTFAWAAGQAWAGGVHRLTCWEGTVSRGVGQAEFGNALRSVASMLDTHGEFLGGFVSSGGEVEITVNLDLDASAIANSTRDDEPPSKAFELALYPEFLAALAAVPAVLRVQGWH